MMDLKAILAAKKAAKEQEAKTYEAVAAQTEYLKEHPQEPDAPSVVEVAERVIETTKAAMLPAVADDVLLDTDVMDTEEEFHSLADLVEEDDGAAYDAMQTAIAEEQYAMANPAIEPEPLIVWDSAMPPDESLVIDLPPADVPAESFVPAKPMTFAERIAASKAEVAAKKLEAQQQQAVEHDKVVLDEIQKKIDATLARHRKEAADKLVTERILAEAKAKQIGVHAPDKQAESSEKFQAGMATVISNAVGKLSFAEKMALKQHAQEQARQAVEEMDMLVAEPPAVLPDELSSIDELAITKAYEDEVEDAVLAAEDDQEVVPDTSSFSLSIVLNERQLMAKELALKGQNFALIGAAGTGKTTTQRSVAQTLVNDKRLKTTSYKVVGGTPGQRVNAPSIAFVAYTRRASANLARAIHKDPDLEEQLRHNIMTIHALLEFEPETFWNDEKQKEDFRFVPRRNAANPLTITHLVIEEASMLGLDLWDNLFDALPHGVQIIFIGDINQLPPVFGASILNYALVQLPIVELTEVYRNAGIVLASAHNVLAGKPLVEGESHDDEGHLTGKVTIVRGKSPVQVGQGKTAMTLGKMFKQWYEMGYYDPEDCMILSPWNKKDLGTDNMNSWIAQFLGEKRGAVVYEVISGFNKLYLAVGDRVMYNKQDAIIKEIKFNGMYHGKDPQSPGSDLGRFGVRILGATQIQETEALEDQLLTYQNFSVDELEETAMERKQQASHVVVIETETGQILNLSAAGDFGPQMFSLGYVLTVHKAQGCEWKKVFIILHKDHAVSLTRELFYTALTRSRLECVVIAKDTVIEKAIATQRIKGNTLRDKVEFFNSGALDIGAVSCVK